MEFLVSPEVRNEMSLDSKFGRIWLETQESLPTDLKTIGWEIPNSMKWLVEKLRNEISSIVNEEACSLVSSLINEIDPPFLKELNL